MSALRQLHRNVHKRLRVEEKVNMLINKNYVQGIGNVFRLMFFF